MLSGHIKYADRLSENTRNELNDNDISLDDVFNFLDGVRDLGYINMYGAATEIEDHFWFVNNKTSQELLGLWMKTFSERHPE